MCRRLAERSLDAKVFLEYAALLPSDQREAARRAALERAERSNSPVTAGAFLLDLGEGARGRADPPTLRIPERRLLRGPSLAREAPGQNRHSLPAVACYRALTDQILTEVRSTAYRHAERYVDRLRALDSRVGGYGELAAHAQYLADLRERHRRKRSFWELFGASGRSSGGE